MEIAPGIHRVDGVRGANSYVVISNSVIMVIDTGMPGSGRKIADYIAKLVRKPGDTTYIVLTHSDIDHSGGAAELAAITGGKLAMHEADAAVLSGERRGKKPRGMLAPLFGVLSRTMHFQPTKADIMLKEGDIISGYRVVECPGHTPGSIALYHPSDIILVGDALRSDTSGNLRLPSSVMSEDMTQALESVKKLAGLEFSIMLPGHGAPVMRGASQKVKNLLSRAK